MPQRTDGVITHTGVGPTYYCLGLLDAGSLSLLPMKLSFPSKISRCLFFHIFAYLCELSTWPKAYKLLFSATNLSFEMPHIAVIQTSLVMFTQLRAIGDGNPQQLVAFTCQPDSPLRSSASTLSNISCFSPRLSKLSYMKDSSQIYSTQQRRARPRLRTVLEAFSQEKIGIECKSAAL